LQEYRRSDAPERRRKLMDAWSAFCEQKSSANVVQLRKQKPLWATGVHLRET
jgi:hypothetical protein